MAKTIFTDAQVIDQIDSGWHWSGTSLTYGFPASASWMPYGEATGFSTLNANQRVAATLAIGLWDDLMAVDFSLSPDDSANIRFSNSTTNVGYAHAYYPGYWSAAGSVWFNTAYDASSGTNDLMNPTLGNWGFQAYVHEIGHALGLDHPGNYNGGNPSYENDALYAQDSQMYTIMSYFGAGNTGADWWASDGRWYYAQTPMLHDVMVLQAMYGVETTTRAGDTVYGFNSNAGTWVFDFAQNAHPVVTIFDSSGNDTLDLSGWNTPSVINLAPGSYSNADMMTFNIAIAHTATIENAVGGGGGDTITGNAAANTLSGHGGADTLNGGDANDTLIGGGGNDTLDGGDGSGDIARFAGARGDYSIVYNAATTTFTVSDLRAGAADGVDRVTGVEYFAFSDRTVTAASLGGGPAGGGTDGDDALTGTVDADSLAGLGGNDTIDGLGGADTLDGGAGNDRMSGGAGNDIYVVGSAQDVVVEAAGEGADTILTTLASLTIGANVENVRYTGAGAFSGYGNAERNVMQGAGGNDMLTGNAGIDQLFGHAGADRLYGGDGGDFLTGGAGADLLSGGAGADTFRFLAANDSGPGAAADRLADFSAAEGDKINLSAIDANSGVAGDQAFAFIGGAAFGGVAGQLRYASSVLSGDINGDGVADFAIRMTNGAALVDANFVL